MVRRAQLPNQLEGAVLLRFVGADLTVTEVADQQIAAEAPEVRRRPGDAPRSVELPVRRDAAQEGSRGAEHVDEAHALPLDVVLLAHVGRHDERHAAGISYLLRRPLQRRLVTLRDDHPGALGGEPPGDRRADALGRAGDNRDFSCELAHVRSPAGGSGK